MPSSIFYPIVFVFALGSIVFVHELGHHLMAKVFGARVRTFSLGFGRRLWGFEWGGTDYRVSVLPLGGYVRLEGEMPGEQSGHPHDFNNKPRWQRILFYLAGPAMNVVLSVTLIAAVFANGIHVQAFQDLPPVVGQVLEGSRGEQAGLEIGDRVLTVDGDAVATWGDLDFQISTSPERNLNLQVERGSETLAFELRPEKEPRDGIGLAGLGPKLEIRLTVIEGSPAQAGGVQSGDVVVAVNGALVNSGDDFVAHIEPSAGQPLLLTVRRGDATRELTVVPEDVDGKGRIGVQLGAYRALPLGEALVASVYYNVDIVHKTGQVLAKLFTAEMEAKTALSGPIEIGRITGEAARMGFKELIFVMGFLSISIGIMNLLPVPMLDGGHIAILLIESAMRRDLSMITKEKVNLVGFVILMLLMVTVVLFDLSKNLPMGS